MKKGLIVLFLVFNLPVFSQTGNNKHIFTDTSLYFIQPMDSLNMVQLSLEELRLAEELFLEAVKDFNEYRQRYIDSLRSKMKKRKEKVPPINVDGYFFRLIPSIDSENQKTVHISGVCKDWFNTGKTDKTLAGKTWKKQFVDGTTVFDGGSCFIYADINLTLKIYNRFRMNGEG